MNRSHHSQAQSWLTITRSRKPESSYAASSARRGRRPRWAQRHRTAEATIAGSTTREALGARQLIRSAGLDSSNRITNQLIEHALRPSPDVPTICATPPCPCG